MKWNSYRGNFRNDTDDLRCVLNHELGHAIGLDHPDEFGQTVNAVMNAFVGDNDTVVADDIQGGQAMYGARMGGKLSSFSVRAKTGGEFGTLILGFATAGTSKQVLIRGMSPSTAAFGVLNPMPNPRMDMVSNQVTIDEADDWGDESNSAEISARGAALGAFPPTSSLEAILLRSVDPSLYTVLVSDFQHRTGEVLIEAYDADALSAAGRLTNLSTRTEVGGTGRITHRRICGRWRG